LERFKVNLRDQFQLSEIEADQIVFFIQVMFSDLSKILVILIPFAITGYLIEYLSILSLTFILRTQSGGFHFKSYFSCLFFTGLYFVTITILSTLSLSTSLLIILGVVHSIIIFLLSPMLSEQRKKLKSVNLKSLKIRSTAIAALLVSFYLIKTTPFTLCAIWVVISQGTLLLIQKGVLHVTR